MMDSYTCRALIQEIADQPSRMGKEALIRDLANDELGAFLIRWAYDPFITYGVKPAFNHTPDKPNLEFRPSIIEPLLQRLAKRELTGRAAEREIADTMMALNESAAYLLFLVLSKDLKCGIAEATINLAVPGLIPTFSVARAQPYEAKRVKTWPWKGEPKLDGNRNTFLCKDGKGAFFTRSGKIVPALNFLVPFVIKAAEVAVQKSARLSVLMMEEEGKLSFMLDGEAMMGLFEDTGALRRKDVDAVGAELHLYDIMSYADFNAPGAVGRQLFERRDLLSVFVDIAREVLGKDGPIQIVPQYFINSDDEAQAFFERMRSRTLASYLARGDASREAELLKTTIDKATGKPKVLEGAMLKDPMALYEKRKSAVWMKMKAEETEDLIVIGAYPGEPHTKYENCLGGLVLDRNGVNVRVGGGFTDVEREEIWAQVEKDFAKIDPTQIVLDKTARIYNPGNAGMGVLGRLLEVEYHEVTPDGSLRHPRFVRWRSDKEGELAA
jgi:ATP-dependent DNA ligase